MLLSFTIPKLACAACVATVSKAIQALDAAAQVNGDPRTKQLQVTTTADPVQVRQALSQVGYPPV